MNKTKLITGVVIISILAGGWYFYDKEKKLQECLKKADTFGPMESWKTSEQKLAEREFETDVCFKRYK